MPESRRVVEHLPDDLPANLRVRRELALHQGYATLGTNDDEVCRTCARLEFPAGNRAIRDARDELGVFREDLL
ncbi:hypothetical protein [Arthrobacter sp. H41]|uniref:hypothetical protein n=1 Tax=Arthrobacter sp. H41 TaxID=1312978 RepID=UPI000676A5F3|nr:hypothetical protein [Arthrobacter sp. H41]